MGALARLTRDLNMPGSDDGLGPDFSGVRAHAALELHMRECTERRTEDRADRATTNARLNAMQESFDSRLSQLNDTFDKRMGVISNRLWGTATAIIVLLVSALGTVLFFYVIAKGVK